MSRETLVFLLGIFVFFIPHLGIPLEWKTYALSGIGIVLILVGYSLRRTAFLHRIDQGNGERSADSFVEATEPLFDSRMNE